MRKDDIKDIHLEQMAKNQSIIVQLWFFQEQDVCVRVSQ